MANFYDVADVVVNGSGIMAQSVSVSSRNSVEGLKALGRKGQFQYGARGPLETNISIDYYLEPGNEPNYARLTTWKTDTTNNHFLPIRLEIMGITGSGWIDKYTVKGVVNEPARASVSYVVYSEMVGVNTTGITGVYDQSQIEGIAHGWSTTLLPNTSRNTLYSEFEYECALEWKPLFILGQKAPAQMQLVGATEEMSIIRNVYKNITFSGQPSHEYYDITGIQMDGLAAYWGDSTTGINFNVSGVPVINSDFTLNTNGYLNVRSSIRKYY